MADIVPLRTDISPPAQQPLSDLQAAMLGARRVRPGDRVRVHPMGYPSVLRGAEGIVARVLWDGAGIVIRLPDGSERLVDYTYIMPVAAEGD